MDTLAYQLESGTYILAVCARREELPKHWPFSPVYLTLSDGGFGPLLDIAIAASQQWASQCGRVFTQVADHCVRHESPPHHTFARPGEPLRQTLLPALGLGMAPRKTPDGSVLCPEDAPNGLLAGRRRGCCGAEICCPRGPGFAALRPRHPPCLAGDRRITKARLLAPGSSFPVRLCFSSTSSFRKLTVIPVDLRHTFLAP